MSDWIPLAPFSDMEDDQMYSFEIGDRRIVAYRMSGQVYATDNICSHAFALLTDGWLDDGLVECPLHGAQFDVKTGAVVRGPADCPIATFPARIREGIVEVLVPGSQPDE